MILSGLQGCGLRVLLALGEDACDLTLPLVSREWRNGSNSTYNCTPKVSYPARGAPEAFYLEVGQLTRLVCNRIPLDFRVAGWFHCNWSSLQSVLPHDLAPSAKKTYITCPYACELVCFCTPSTPHIIHTSLACFGLRLVRNNHEHSHEMKS